MNTHVQNLALWSIMPKRPNNKRARLFIAAAALTTVAIAFFVVRGTSGQETTDFVVYKGATCYCCVLWVEYLEEAGYTVRSVDTDELNQIKMRHGVPGDLRSCHTAIVGDYVIEGHVPLEDIQRLLDEKPAVAGIAVPGMPIGTPGMEQGDRYDPYDVIAFTTDGRRGVFASHNK